MLADEYMRPWSDRVLEDLEGVTLLDAHTHIGSNDADGFLCDLDVLQEALDQVRSRAVIIPMHEPDGYAQANSLMLEAAAASNGRLVAFCRVSCDGDPASEVRRCVEAGARGIKLHPRSDRFRCDDDRLDAVFEYADEHRIPVLIHAGRGMPALGDQVIRRCREHPRTPIILAHAGVSELSSLVHLVPEHENLFFDTACFAPADLLMLFAEVPPGRIVFGSDVPYATAAQGVIFTFRCAMQAGLSRDQLRSVAGEQLQRLLDRSSPLDLGPAPGPSRLRNDPVLERAHGWVMLAIGQLGVGGTGERPVGLARLACNVPPHRGSREVCQSVLALLDRHDAYMAQRGLPLADGPVDYGHLHLLGVAAVVAKTPDVPVPPCG